MSILSIQSMVAYGHVGNSAAVFPLQKLGFDVWPVNTVQFSNHPGYGAFKGKVTDSADLAEMIKGMEERQLFPDCEAVLSGYLGSLENGRVVRNAVLNAQSINPDILYCCDPIIGDWEEGIYVSPELPAFFRDELVPLAHILTPNAFELEQLTGKTVTTMEETVGSAQGLAAKMAGTGPQIVAVTSLRLSGGHDEDKIQTLVVTPKKAWLVETPKLDLKAKGTGDVFTALFLGNYLKKGKPDKALKAATGSLFAIIESTSSSISMELKLIEKQTAINKSKAKIGISKIV